MKTPTDPKLPCDHLFKRAVDKALERPIVTGSDEFRSYIEWYLGPTHVEVSCDFFTVINRSATALSQSYSQFYLLYIFAKLLTKSSEVAGMLQGYSALIKGIRTNNGCEVLNRVIKNVVLLELVKGRVCEVLKELVEGWVEDVEIRMSQQVIFYSLKLASKNLFSTDS